MKEDVSIIDKIEEKIGKAWKTFREEYAAWEAQRPACGQDNALREWERTKPKFGYGFVKKLLRKFVRKITDGKDIIYWDDGEYEKGYVRYDHFLVMDGEIVGHIYEKYYDDGRYTLDVIADIP